MGLATLMAVPAFEKHGFQKWVRIAFLANGLVTPLIAFVYFYPNYSETVLILGYPWAITAPLSMLMLALMLKKEAAIYKLLQNGDFPGHKRPEMKVRITPRP
jgi:hypothetical protein